MALATAAQAADYLESSGANQCSDQQEGIINVTGFRLYYKRDSTEASYSVNATSTEEVDVLARIQVVVYGNTVVDQLLDMCADGISELCPLKKGTTNTGGTHKVPSKYTSSINQIAYTIPDLEVEVNVMLYNASDPSQNIGCFNSLVSNGKTAATNGAKWGTLAIAAAILLIAGASASSASSGTGGGAGGGGAGHGPVVGPGTNVASGGFHAPGFAEFFAVLQGIAVSGMYSLEYPTVYRSFSQNIGWSAGMISWAGMQESIDNLRRRTGGNMTESSYKTLQDTTLIYQNGSLNNADQLIPSSLLASLTTASKSSSSIISSSSATSMSSTDTTSPITSTIWVDPPGSSSTSAVTSSAQAAKRLVARAASSATSTIKSSATATSSSASSSVSATSTSQSQVKVVTGIQAYVEKLNIPNTNAFLTLLVWYAIILGLVIFVMMALKLYLDLIYIREYKKDPKFIGKMPGYRQRFPNFLFTMIIRLIILFYGLWVLYSLYQFKVGDSWGTVLLAGITFGIFTALLLVLSARIVILSRRAMKQEGGLENLFYHEPWIRKYGVLYDQFRTKFWWFFIPILVVTFTRNAFLALGTGNGLVQVVGQLVVDFILLALMVYFKPFNTKWGNGINISIQAVRVLSLCLLTTFTKQAKLSKIASTGVGFALIVIQALLSITLISLIALGGILTIIRYIKNNNNADANSEAENQGLFMIGDDQDYHDGDFHEMEEAGRLDSHPSHARVDEKNRAFAELNDLNADRSSSPTEYSITDGDNLIRVFSNSSGYEDALDHQTNHYNGLTPEQYEKERNSIRLVQSSILTDSIHSSEGRVRNTLSDVDSLRDSLFAHQDRHGSSSPSQSMFGTPPLVPTSGPGDRLAAPDVFSRMRRAPSRNSMILAGEHVAEPHQADFVGELMDLSPPKIRHTPADSEGNASVTSSHSNQSLYTTSSSLAQPAMPPPPIPVPTQPESLGPPPNTDFNKSARKVSYQSTDSINESVFSWEAGKEDPHRDGLI